MIGMHERSFSHDAWAICARAARSPPTRNLPPAFGNGIATDRCSLPGSTLPLSLVISGDKDGKRDDERARETCGLFLLLTSLWRRSLVLPISALRAEASFSRGIEFRPEDGPFWEDICTGMSVVGRGGAWVPDVQFRSWGCELNGK